MTKYPGNRIGSAGTKFWPSAMFLAVSVLTIIAVSLRGISYVPMLVPHFYEAISFCQT